MPPALPPNTNLGGKSQAEDLVDNDGPIPCSRGWAWVPGLPPGDRRQRRKRPHSRASRPRERRPRERRVCSHLLLINYVSQGEKHIKGERRAEMQAETSPFEEEKN